MAKRRRWTIEQLKKAVEVSFSFRQVLKELDLRPTGGNYDQLRRYLSECQFDTSHFTGQLWNKGKRGIGKPRIPLESILVEGSWYQSFKLKRRLFVAGLKKAECEECGWAKRSEEGYLPLELDHINGNRHDNRLENLRVLCPNCHSLKPTHRGRNRKLRRGGEIGKHATLKMS